MIKLAAIIIYILLFIIILWFIAAIIYMFSPLIELVWDLISDFWRNLKYKIKK